MSFNVNIKYGKNQTLLSLSEEITHNKGEGTVLLTTEQVARYLVSPQAVSVITGKACPKKNVSELALMELEAHISNALKYDHIDRVAFNRAFKECTGLDFIHKDQFQKRVENYTNVVFLAKLNGFEKLSTYTGTKRPYFGWALLTKQQITHKKVSPLVEWDTVIPIFSAYLSHLTTETSTVEKTPAVVITTESNKTIEGKQNMFEKLKNQNVEAAKLAGKLTLGKAANELVANALVARLPWYQRLFSSALLRDSSVSKLVTANLAVVLATHFGKQSKELELVTDAMLQDAMVELVRDSDAVTGILNQLTGLAGNLVGETK